MSNLNLKRRPVQVIAAEIANAYATARQQVEKRPESRSIYFNEDGTLNADFLAGCLSRQLAFLLECATKVSAPARRAVDKYTAWVCLEAYRLSEQGEGPSNIAHSFLSLRTVAAANAAINAGRELSGH